MNNRIGNTDLYKPIGEVICRDREITKNFPKDDDLLNRSFTALRDFIKQCQ